MSVSQHSPQTDIAARLQHFEKLLKFSKDDQSAMQTVFRTIREVLSEGHDCEADLRRIIDTAHADGGLDDDSYITVKRMLDRIVFDFHATMPEGDREFAATEVIAKRVEEPENLAERLQAGTVLRDRFLLQRKIAGGSMGVVYKALDRRLAEVDEADPWVAIKVLTPKLSRNADALRAMQQEAAKGRSLTHPNIVRFVDLDREGDLYFIVMEWIEGRSLAAILDDPDDDTVDLEMSLSIVVQIGHALEYAHSCGVVHADVKPGNIMVTPDGDVKLIDFGVARIRQKQSSRPTKFDPGVLGAATPAYSSMQVLTGEDPVPADDVFSLGCLLYRLVAGHRVFGPRNAAEAAEAGMAPERLPGLNDNQWRALKRALSFSRVTRHATPTEFLDDLLASAPASPSVKTENAPALNIPVEPRPEPDEPKRWPLYAGLLALAGGIAVVGTQTNYLDAIWAKLPSDWGMGRSQIAAPASTEQAPGDAAVADAPVEPSDSRAPSDTPNPEPSVLDGGVTPSADAADSPPAMLEEPAAETATNAAGIVVPAAGSDVGIAEETPDVEALPSLETPDTAEVVEMAPPGTTFEQSASLDPPTHTLTLARPGGRVSEVDVVLREDADAVDIELRRIMGLNVPLALRIEEVRFSGNRSPWDAGQYTIANDGVVRFEAGQDSARVEISMMSDPLREPDRQVDLVVRELDTPDAERARISLTLEDDDQRAFEGELAPNTVAFAVSQVSVAEADPAVQIDILRFNPDSQPLDVSFEVQDVTATEGEDYFAPRVKSVAFAPDQRTVRLLIPLVQDSSVESDEAFFLEIDGRDFDTDADIFRRIAVMIRDDDLLTLPTAPGGPATFHDRKRIATIFACCRRRYRAGAEQGDAARRRLRRRRLQAPTSRHSVDVEHDHAVQYAPARPREGGCGGSRRGGR